MSNSGSEKLEVIDILSFLTNKLENDFSNAADAGEEWLMILEFLRNCDVDPALNELRNLKITFEKDLDWFNVRQSLTSESLIGKLVILDFFTYCCINCMHVFSELRTLEDEFCIEDGLVIVGVHSPKFENEKQSSNILAAVQRYNIRHPIVNDPQSILWNQLQIKCWPTLLVLSPNGVPLVVLMGEGHCNFLRKFIPASLKYFTQRGEIQKKSLEIRIKSTPGAASKLRFPTKITCSEIIGNELNCYAVSDTGNNRILIIDSHGNVLHRIGGFEAGFIDGDFDEAKFRSPHGLAFVDRDVLVVADTENHAIRQITLSTGRVHTLVGTGKQGMDKIGGQLGIVQEISSPWDVAVYKTRDMDMSFHIDEECVKEKTIILIAMAGIHQIWAYFPDGIIWWKFKKFEPNTCASLIGNGLEENRNNSYPQNAAFAQPSGLSMAKELLFIADSESSSIRRASMIDGKVSAVVGGDRNPLNLFAFGDHDGKQYHAKLQHPLGVAYNTVTEKVYVADTYNHKIKCIDIGANTVNTCSIKDNQSKPYCFNEPSGLCCSSDCRKLLVVDTNNHGIQVVDLQTMTTTPLPLDFSGIYNTTKRAVDAPLLHARIPFYSCDEIHFKLLITLEDGLQFTKDAPQTWVITDGNFRPGNNEAPKGQLIDGLCDLSLKRVPGGKKTNGKADDRITIDIRLSVCDSKCCSVKKFSLLLTDSCSENEGGPRDRITHTLKLIVKQDGIRLS